MEFNEIYKHVTYIFENLLGKKGITNGEELDELARKVFGKQYRGMYIEGETLPTLKNNQFIIKNKPYNEHWILVFKKNNELWEFDSFGRDLLGKKYKDFNTKTDSIIDQNPLEHNCGQRVLALAFILFKM